MSYEEFEEALVSALKQQLPEDVSVQVRNVHMTNSGNKRAVIVGAARKELCPTFNLESLFEEYEKGVSMDHLTTMILEDYSESRQIPQAPEDFFCDYRKVRPNIRCKLVSMDRNLDVMKDMPYQLWEDLAVICYYQFDPAWVEDASILITHEYLQSWKITADQLFHDAWENMQKLEKPVFRKLSSVLNDMQPDEEPVRENECPLYVLTNKERYFGAVTIAYPHVIEKISEKIHGDYFVLPSSVHECLILPDDGSYSIRDLNGMVREINMTQLEDWEVLSDHVYHISAGKAPAQGHLNKFDISYAM